MTRDIRALFPERTQGPIYPRFVLERGCFYEKSNFDSQDRKRERDGTIYKAERRRVEQFDRIFVARERGGALFVNRFISQSRIITFSRVLASARPRQ